MNKRELIFSAGKFKADNLLVLKDHLETEFSATKEMETVLLSLIESIPEGVFAIDKGFNIIFANQRVIENVHRITGMRVKIGDKFPEWNENEHVTNEWKGYLKKALSGEYFNVRTTVIVECKPLTREVYFRPIKTGESITGAVCFIKELENFISRETEPDIKYRSLIDRNNQSVALAGLDGKFKCITPSIERILNFSHHTLIGKEVMELVHPDDYSTLSHLLDQLFPRFGRTVSATYRMKSGEGCWKWIRASITNMLHEPKIDAMVFNFEDVTVRQNSREVFRKTSQKLLDAAERQAAILDSLDSNIALLDEHGNIIEVNEAWKKFGSKNGLKNPNHGIGSNYLAITDKAADECPVAGDIATGIRKVLLGSLDKYSNEYSFDIQGIKHWFSIVVTPLSKKGNGGAVVSHTDITTRKQTELQLKYEQKNLDGLINSTSDLMWSIDKHMRLKTANQAYRKIFEERSGVKPEYGKVTLDSKRFSPAEVSAWKDRYTRVLSGISFTEEIYHPESDTWAEISFNPVFEQEEVIGAACYARDSTDRIKIAEIIRKSEQMMSEAESVAHFGSWEYSISTENDKISNQLTWSDEAFRIFGFEPGECEISRENFLNMVYTGDKKGLLSVVNEAFENIQPFNYELRIVRNDGELRWIHLEGMVFKNKKGLPEKMVGTVLDITERKRTTEELRRAELTYREIFDKNYDAIFVHDIHTGLVVDINLKATEITGFSKAEIMNGHPDNLIATDEGFSWKEAQNYLRKAAEGQPQLFEWKSRRKDGSTFWCEVNLTKANIAGTDRILAFFHEISDRKEAEEKLRKSEESYRRIIETAQEGIWMVDQYNKTTYVNQMLCEIMEYSPAEMSGKSYFEFLHEKDIRLAKEANQRRRSGVKESIAIRFITKSGKIVWTNISASPLHDQNGRYAGALAMVSDITDRKQVEEALQLSNERYRLSTRATNDAIWDWNIATDELYWSEAYQNMFGHNIDADNCNLASWEKNLHPEDKARVISSIQDELNNPHSQSWQCEYRYRRADNTYAYIFDRGYILYNNNREPVRMVGAMQDITERKLTEVALEKKTADINKRARELNALYRISVISFNPLLTTDEILQKCLKIIASAYQYPEVTCVRIKLEGKTFSTYNFRQTPWKQDARMYINGEADGIIEVFYLEEKPAAYEGPFLKEEVSFISSVARNLSITLEHRKAENALFRSETNLRTIFDHTDNAYLLLDANLNLLSFNIVANNWAMNVYGKQLTEGESIMNLFPEGSEKHAENNFQHVLAGHTIEDETALPAVHGKLRWFYSKMSPVHNNIGETIGVSIASKDITDRKNYEIERERMTNEIIQRNNELEQFAYIISHNLRAPVANIIGCANILENGELDADEAKEMMKGLSISVSRLDNVIVDLNEILQVKRHLNERKEKVKFSEIFQSIEQSIGNQIFKAQAKILYDLSEVEEIVVFKSYLYSIFYNLMTNSIKYKRPGVPPFIEIKSEKSGENVIISFKDNGLGIDLNKSGHQLFGLYKRFHLHTAEGKGLGLFMVKNQVEALGGSITVQSEVNKGTVFKIKLKII